MWYLSRSIFFAEFEFELGIQFGVELSEILQLFYQAQLYQDCWELVGRVCEQSCDLLLLTIIQAVNLNEYVSKASCEIQHATVDIQIRNPACGNNVLCHLSPYFLLVHVTGLQTCMGIWVWVRQVQVQVQHKIHA